MAKGMYFKSQLLVFLVLLFTIVQSRDHETEAVPRRYLTGSSSESAEGGGDSSEVESSESASASASESASASSEGGGDSSHSSSEEASSEGGGDSSHSSSEEASSEGGGDSSHSSSEEASSEGGGDSSHSSSEEAAGGGDSSADGGGDSSGAGGGDASQIDEDISTGGTAFSMAMAVIIAREFIEAVCIMGGVRTGIQEIDATEEIKAALLKSSTMWALTSGGLALAIAIIVGIILGAISGEVDFATQEILEGISKLIAFVFVAKIALKVPKWAGIYPGKKKKLTAEIVDNVQAFMFWQVGWNIFREMLEIGLFMIPYALAGKMAAFPLSLVVGVSIMCACVGGYLVSKYFSNEKVGIQIMIVITVMLATGLMSTGCHEFEEVYGLTPRTYDLGEALTHKKLPFSIVRVFGYSATPTVLEVVMWWFGFVIQVALHYIAANKEITDSTTSYATDDAVIVDVKGDIEMAKPGHEGQIPLHEEQIPLHDD